MTDGVWDACVTRRKGSSINRRSNLPTTVQHPICQASFVISNCEATIQRRPERRSGAEAFECCLNRRFGSTVLGRALGTNTTGQPS